MPLGRSGVSNFAYTSTGVALGVSADEGLSGAGVQVLPRLPEGLVWEDEIVVWETNFVIWEAPA